MSDCPQDFPFADGAVVNPTEPSTVCRSSIKRTQSVLLYSPDAVPAQEKPVTPPTADSVVPLQLSTSTAREEKSGSKDNKEQEQGIADLKNKNTVGIGGAADDISFSDGSVSHRLCFRH